jgi:hypothetical protein
MQILFAADAQPYSAFALAKQRSKKFFGRVIFKP